MLDREAYIIFASFALFLYPLCYYIVNSVAYNIIVIYFSYFCCVLINIARSMVDEVAAI